LLLNPEAPPLLPDPKAALLLSLEAVLLPNPDGSRIAD
jgi:hypothetical protein